MREGGMKIRERATVAAAVVSLLVAVLALGRDLFDITIPGFRPAANASTASAKAVSELDAAKTQSAQRPKPTTQDLKGADHAAQNPNRAGNTVQNPKNAGRATQQPGRSNSHRPQAPAVPAVVDPQISLSPAVGPAGSAFTVSGRGYSPRGRVTVRFNAAVVAEGQAGGDGSFTLTAYVPGGLRAPAPASFPVRATDSATSRGDEAPFAVVPRFKKRGPNRHGRDRGPMHGPRTGPWSPADPATSAAAENASGPGTRYHPGHSSDLVCRPPYCRGPHFGP
ncbi:hypothetical protein Areg01_78830 [Actinoplanes regularis]|nr:hypothetical protein Areg01_78830 [Actinoplanes regularis]